MANFKQTGIKISQYHNAQTDTDKKKGKLVLEHFLVSYAPSYFGTATINKNYKIPVQSLREDLSGYIGVSNAKANWRNTIKIWSGEWESDDITNSYVYQWSDNQVGDYDYIDNKFTDEEGVDKLYIIKNAPLPQTDSAKTDPKHESTKIVDKDYIDNRFNGIPKIEWNSTTLPIHSYSCVYVFTNTDTIDNINIVDSLVDEQGRNLATLLNDKCLQFFLKIPTKIIPYTDENNSPSSTFEIKYNDMPCKWGFRNELIQILHKANQENIDYVWVKCFAEYINDVFVIRCSFAFNLLENEVILGVTGVCDEIKEEYSSSEVTSEHAVVNYVTKHTTDTDVHVTEDKKSTWDAAAQYKIETSSNYIDVTQKTNNTQTVSLKVNTNISNDNSTVPTTKAVYDYVEDTKGINYEYNTDSGKTTKMRFLGKYVLMQEKEDGSIDLIFGPNNNPAGFSKVTEILGNNWYVFESTNGTYQIPSLSDDGKFATVVANNTTQTIYLNGNGVEMSYGGEFTAKCTITRSTGEDIVLIHENVGSKDGTLIKSDDLGLVTFELKDVHKNSIDNEADSDYTPGHVRFKGKITINNGILPDGGYYTVKVEIGNKSSSTNQVFVYKPEANGTKPTISTPSYTSTTRQVSGITYDDSATLSFNVSNIENTQKTVASTDERLKISFKGNTSKYSINPSSSTITKSNLNLASGDSNKDNAVYETNGNLSYAITGVGNNVTKFSDIIYAKSNGQTTWGSAQAQTITGTNYIWSKGGKTDTLTTSYFIEDGKHRILGYLDSNNKLVITNNGYESSKSLASETDYTNQLMIQGGCLKHPSKDTTGTYTSVTNTRYYVRKVKFDGDTSKQIDTLTITWNNVGSSFPSGVKMYLAKNTTDGVQELTELTNQGENGCATGKPTNSSWKVQPKGIWNVFGGTDYYLIISMDSTAPANLGQLTIQ